MQFYKLNGEGRLIKRNSEAFISTIGPSEKHNPTTATPPSKTSETFVSQSVELAASGSFCCGCNVCHSLEPAEKYEIIPLSPMAGSLFFEGSHVFHVRVRTSLNKVSLGGGVLFFRK